MNINDFKTKEDPAKPKCYVLDMFPYPSGEGLHMGHVKVYTASDIYARYKRMKGYNVLHPTGFDAFGLPAEQFALKHKTHPRVSTDKNIATYLKQMKALDFSYDFDRVVDTTDPNFYKWTQWIFKQIYKKGLAYESNEPINWCPSCKTGLANEDLEGNACERCGTVVEKKPLRQWVLKITDYADRLIDDLDTLTDWPQSFVDLEKNWIGRSEGSSFVFTVEHEAIKNVEIFTTRADTLFGATYVAISFDLAEKWIKEGWVASSPVVTFIETLKEEDKARTFDRKDVIEKKGIATGLFAINPANGKRLPIWIADYVLAGYGTGAIMAVPAHDDRDYDFAKKYNIEIQDVISKHFVLTGSAAERAGAETVVRKVVDPIIRDEEGNFYCIKEPNGDTHFAGGGVDDGETEEEAIRREVTEETGFTDFSVTKKVVSDISVWGYRHTKERNQRTIGPAYEVVLHSKTRIHSEVEDGKHELVVLKKDDVLASLSWEHHRFLFEEYLKELSLFVDGGILINSGVYDGMPSAEAKIKITEDFGGKLVKQYKLKDWVFSRQRYWGEPFPIVFDENHTSYVVADSELPVKLPDVKEYEPTGTGESPLANITEWVEVYGYLNKDNEFVSVDKSDARAKLFKRETNTMPQWAGSSWYYLRFIDAHNDKELLSKDLEKYWQPVDVYVGGAEHATRHLIYARFWHKFLYDLGVVSTVEPFLRLESVGLVLGEGGVKMSKRLGNIINPDDVIKEHGSDVARMYMMFMGPFGQSSAWDSKSIQGVKKFLERVTKMSTKIGDIEGDAYILNQTIKKIGEDVEEFKFNTSISQLMILLNSYEAKGGVTKESFSTFLLLLAPFAPALSEELWGVLGNVSSIHMVEWPTYDEKYLVTNTVTMAIQIAGKMRGTIETTRDSDDSAVIDLVKAHEIYKKYVGGAEPKKVIIVKNKIVNIVI